MFVSATLGRPPRHSAMDMKRNEPTIYAQVFNRTQPIPIQFQIHSCLNADVNHIK